MAIPFAGMQISLPIFAHRRLSGFSYAFHLGGGASRAIRTVVENNSIEINVRFGFAADAAADTRNSDFPAPRYV